MNSGKTNSLVVEHVRLKNEEPLISEKKVGEKVIDIINGEDNSKYAPEDYLTVNGISKNYGLNYKVVKKKIKELENAGLSGYQLLLKDGRPAIVYSPEQQEEILASLSEFISIKDAPENYLTINGMSEKWGINYKTLNNRIDALEGVEAEKYRDKKGNIAFFFSPDQQQIILESLNKHISTVDAPKRYYSLKDLSKKLSVNYHTLKKIVEKYEIRGEEYKDKGGNIRIFYSPEERKTIENKAFDYIKIKKAPKGYDTIYSLAKKYHIGESALRDRVKEMGIEGEKMKDAGGKPAVFFSQKQQEMILKPWNNTIVMKRAPEDYLTVDGMSKKWGINFKTLSKKVSELNGLKTEEFKNEQGKPSAFYSPEEQQKIFESLGDFISMKNVTEGYFSVDKLSREIGVSPRRIQNIIASLGTQSYNFKSSIGKIERYYSLDDKETIIDSLERSRSGTSIPENTIAFYLSKNGRRIKQGFRPNWLKNPNSGRNLEIDIFVDPPGVGIEYDGSYYHQDIEHDIKKDNIAQQSGYRIIHIREDGCPEMPEGSHCIKRKNNSDDADLEECIRECFKMLNISVPDIDVARDKKDIMAFMRQRVLGRLNSVKTFDELSVVS